MLIMEDPPIHDVHRKLLARMFKPRKVESLEPKIREFCTQALDPLVGTGGFDFVTDLGAQMPVKIISTLLGIPEDDLCTRSGAHMSMTGTRGSARFSATSTGLLNKTLQRVADSRRMTLSSAGSNPL
jgi:cytochrome P450